jgi:hypothetical protein
MKALTWHGKYDLRCESVPDPEIKAMMNGDGDVVSGWQNKLRAAISNIVSAASAAEQHRKMAEPGPGLKK